MLYGRLEGGYFVRIYIGYYNVTLCEKSCKQKYYWRMCYKKYYFSLSTSKFMLKSVTCHLVVNLRIISS